MVPNKDFILSLHPDFRCRRLRNRFICNTKAASVFWRRPSGSIFFSCTLQQSSLYIEKILVQGAVNTLKTAGIAVYTATMQIEGFANSFEDSACHAMSVFISQNHGTGNKDRVALATGLGWVWVVIFLSQTKRSAS